MSKFWQSIKRFFGFGGSTDAAETEYQKIARTVRAYLPTAKALLKAAGTLTLKMAVNDNDRKTIASMISGSGHVFEGLTGLVTTPTQEQAQNALSAYFPTSKAEYAEYVTLVSPILSTVVSMCGTSSDGFKLFCEVMQALAQAAYEVADPYLKTT